MSIKKLIFIFIIIIFIIGCSSLNKNSDITTDDNIKGIHMKIGKETYPPIGFIDMCRRHCETGDPDPQCPPCEELE
jgi:hypothetical protein